MTDGLNAVRSNDRPATTNPNLKNLELAPLQAVTATRLEQLLYYLNCYIQIFRLNFSPQWRSNLQPLEVKKSNALPIPLYVCCSDFCSECFYDL